LKGSLCRVGRDSCHAHQFHIFIPIGASLGAATFPARANMLARKRKMRAIAMRTKCMVRRLHSKAAASRHGKFPEADFGGVWWWEGGFIARNGRAIRKHHAVGRWR